MFRIVRTFDALNNTYHFDIKCELSQEHEKMFVNFFKFYEIDDMHIEPPKKHKLKPKNERVCRFCDKSYPDVKFRKVAHIVPQLLGNRNLISDFECDSCNLHFSRYENDLANFLGVSRTLTSMKGQNGIPTYLTPDSKLIVKENKKTKTFEIISKDSEDHFTIDQETKQLIIKAVKHPYTPINVYKVLLKIGYSLIPENELIYYESVKKILANSNSDLKLKDHPLFRVFETFSPGIPFPSPLIFSCKKQDSANEINIPSRTFIIYFNNYIYQFFIPFCTNDQWMYKKDGKIKCHLKPPFIDVRFSKKFGEPQFFNIELSSNELKMNETHTVSMHFDSAILQ